MEPLETLRAREVYRYYQPRNLAEPSSPNLDKAYVPKETGFDSRPSFSDTALTAFAQLTALRLNSQRAIVSLIDHENEYFLAESTSSLSAIDHSGPAQNALLSISGESVPRAASLCEQTLRLVPNQDTAAGMTPCFLVCDLRLDEKMSRLDCVRGPPHLRFYCGVALTNKKGVNIGCVYVVDDRPRNDITLEDAQFLTRMAATVMDHLENIRAKEDVVRVTRMSQALHAFIEGHGTMSGNWQRLKKYNLPYEAGIGFSWETNKNDDARSYTDGTQQYPRENEDVRLSFNSPWSSSSDLPNVPTLRSVFKGVQDAPDPLNSQDEETSNGVFSDALHSTFSRGSNLVREGMEVDGAVYFDAPCGFYQGHNILQIDPRRLDSRCSSDSASESSDEEYPEVTPRPRSHISPMGQQWSNHTDYNDPSELGTGPQHSSSIRLKSDILGFSTERSSSWNNQTISPTTTFSAIDQNLLMSLVRRYPQGELFVFNQDGLISPPSDANSQILSKLTLKTLVSEDKRTRHMARKRAEMAGLLSAFPGARQIFFVPLHDSTSGCFIGSFAWSTSATRIFSVENHLSYLIAFGHSVMSEVSRLNTLSADRAKGDFINNVSHELRSPLHGILASLEFLADTTLDGIQRNLVDAAGICGRTLLDTVEQVLDFSKLKKLGQESLQPIGAVAVVEMSTVIEEALQGAYAAFKLNGPSSQGFLYDTQSQTANESIIWEKRAVPSGVPGDPLTIIIDIDFKDNWKFLTLSDLWRRLIVNVFGNALKYTHAGYIKVKLEAQRIPISESNQVEKSIVTLTVTDSGPGMSAEFLKRKLFTPFSQEDETGPGTGLGMSIVKQIIDFLDGRIDVQSDYLGTEIKLSMPLENCLLDSLEVSPKSVSHESPIEAVRRRAAGWTVHILGFDSASGLSEIQLGALVSLKASILKYCTEWFNLKLVSSMEAADFVIFDESSQPPSSVPESRLKILLILSSNRIRRVIPAVQLHTSQIIETVSKPCGPHRLARALLNCLDTKDAISNAPQREESSIGLSSPNFIPNQTPASLQTESHSPACRPPLTQRISNVNQSLKFTMVSSPSSTAGTSSRSSDAGTKNRSITSMELDNSHGESTATSDPVPKRLSKMLLVEDNPVNMMLLATYMKKNRWDFKKATNGLLALQAFQESPSGFDIIFMDVSMPVMTGYQATRHIRTLEAERRLAYEHQNLIHSPHLSATSMTSFPFHFYSRSHPSSNPTSPSAFNPTELDFQVSAPRLQLNRPAFIIALTGFSSQKDKEMAFEAGMNVFMTKPVKFQELGKILDDWIKNGEVDAGVTS